MNLPFCWSFFARARTERKLSQSSHKTVVPLLASHQPTRTGGTIHISLSRCTNIFASLLRFFIYVYVYISNPEICKRSAHLHETHIKITHKHADTHVSKSTRLINNKIRFSFAVIVCNRGNRLKVRRQCVRQPSKCFATAIRIHTITVHTKR